MKELKAKSFGTMKTKVSFQVKELGPVTLVPKGPLETRAGPRMVTLAEDVSHTPIHANGLPELLTERIVLGKAG